MASMESYSKVAMERAMKVQKVILRVRANPEHLAILKQVVAGWCTPRSSR